MTRSAIEQMLYMMDSAFDGKDWHSVMTNLGSVKDDEWDWAPPGGKRTISSLVRELGECKYVYDSHAFGDGSIRWDHPGSIPAVPEGAPPSQVIQWLREAHSVVRGHLAAMPEDDGLVQECMSQWGRLVERRFLVKTMIEHDLYHAGEINHIRALAQGDD